MYKHAWFRQIFIIIIIIIIIIYGFIGCSCFLRFFPRHTDSFINNTFLETKHETQYSTPR